MADSSRDFNPDLPLHEQLRNLEARIGVDFSPEEFREIVRLLLLQQYAAKQCHSASGPCHCNPGSGTARRVQESAFLNVLMGRGCHPILVAEIARVFDEEFPHRTVKAAAVHAGVDRRTLERHWKAFCQHRHLRDCMRLVLLLRITQARGSEEKRAQAAGITLETARFGPEPDGPYVARVDQESGLDRRRYWKVGSWVGVASSG